MTRANRRTLNEVARIELEQAQRTLWAVMDDMKQNGFAASPRFAHLRAANEHLETAAEHVRKATAMRKTR